MAFETAKAGWLMRESTFLKRWKKNWFVLYRDGVLKYFEDDKSPSAEEVVIMRTQCMAIKDGLNVTDVGPPAGYSQGCLLKLKLSTGFSWTLCADSPDDMSAWKFALEEARQIRVAPTQQRVTTTTTTVNAPNLYPVLPGSTTTVYQVPGQPGTTSYVVQPAAQTIYVSDPYCYHSYRRRHCGCCHGRGAYGSSWWW